MGRKIKMGLLLLAVALGWLVPGHAAAGGAWMAPVADRYEPGDIATMVGYFERGTDGAERPVFITALPYDDQWNLPDDVDRIPVGTLLAQRTGHGGYLSYRAVTRFQVPEHLVPGVYEVSYDWDNGFLGDLIGGSIYVGVDPGPDGISREWAADEPEITNLADSAVIAMPAGNITAGELRRRDGVGTTEAIRAATTLVVEAEQIEGPTAAIVEPTAEPLISRRSDGFSAGWAIGSAFLAVTAIAAMVLFARRNGSQPRLKR